MTEISMAGPTPAILSSSPASTPIRRERHRELRARPAQPCRDATALRGASAGGIPTSSPSTRDRSWLCLCRARFARARLLLRRRDSIYVAPDSQGQAIGSCCVAMIEGKCGFLGFRQMLAVIGIARPEQRLWVTAARAAGLLRHAGLIKGTATSNAAGLIRGFMQLEHEWRQQPGADPESLPERRFLSRPSSGLDQPQPVFEHRQTRPELLAPLEYFRPLAATTNSALGAARATVP